MSPLNSPSPVPGPFNRMPALKGAPEDLRAVTVLGSMYDRAHLFLGLDGMVPHSQPVIPAIFRKGYSERSLMAKRSTEYHSENIKAHGALLQESIATAKPLLRKEERLKDLLPAIEASYKTLRESVSKTANGKPDMPFWDTMEGVRRAERVLEAAGPLEQTSVDPQVKQLVQNFRAYTESIYEAIKLPGQPNMQRNPRDYRTDDRYVKITSAAGFAGTILFGGIAAASALTTLISGRDDRNPTGIITYGVLAYLCANGLPFGDTQLRNLQNQVKGYVSFNDPINKAYIIPYKTADKPKTSAAIAKKALEKNAELEQLVRNDATPEQIAQFFGKENVAAIPGFTKDREAISALQVATQGKDAEAKTFIEHFFEEGMGPSMLSTLMEQASKNLKA